MEQAAGQSSGGVARLSEQTIDFWGSEVRSPSTYFGETGKLEGGSRGPTPPNAASFLFYSPEKGFERAASERDDSTIEKGDVSVVFSIDAFRPSRENLDELQKLQTGSLRVDLQQGQNMPHLSERLAWSYIGSVVPPGGKALTYRDFQLDPKSTWGKLQRVPLPGGVGFWTWNFFVQQQASVWSRMAGFFKGGEKYVASLGFPSIAVSALKTVDTLLGYLQAHAQSKWVIQSADVPVYATKEARQNIPGRALALRTGNYVVVPEGQADELVGNTTLELQNGFIVPKGTKTNMETVADNTKKDITYIALSVIARPITG